MAKVTKADLDRVSGYSSDVIFSIDEVNDLISRREPLDSVKVIACGKNCLTCDHNVVFPNLEKVLGCLRVPPGIELAAPSLKTVDQRLVVDDGSFLDAPALEKVGFLMVYEGSSFRAQSLKEVSYDILADINSAVSAPALRKVGGTLDVFGTRVELPSLVSLGGLNLDMCSVSLSALKETSSSVRLRGDFELDAPQLQKIGRSLYISDGVEYMTSTLRKISGSLLMGEWSLLSASRLRDIRGYLNVPGSAVLDAPALRMENARLCFALRAPFNSSPS